MNIILNFCTHIEEPWSEELNVVSLSILHKEMSFAIARITLPSEQWDNKSMKTYVRVGLQKNDQIDTLFFGKITAFPIDVKNGLVTIEAIAEPENYSEQLQNFIQQSKMQNLHEYCYETIIVDDLFYPSKNNPTIFVEGTNDVFFWDMRSNNLFLSNVHHGKRNFIISDEDIIKDSVKIRIAREPYGIVSVALSTKWQRYNRDVVDLYPIIAAHFKSGIINSFTDIKTDLNHMNDKVMGEIKEINPNTTLTKYPMTSPEFSAGKKKCRFRRFYYDGALIADLSHHQLIEETVRFNVVSNKNGRQKHINISLNNIQTPRQYPYWKTYTYYDESETVLYNGHIWKCTEQHKSQTEFDTKNWRNIGVIPDALQDDSCNSFFQTARGKNAIKYAVQKALALMNYSMRHIEINFAIPLHDHFWDIDLDSEIELNLKDIGRLKGKVIQTRMAISYEHRILYITIGCGRNFTLPTNWTPEVHAPENCPQNLVTGVFVENPPEEQINALSKISVNSVQELKKSLQKMPTKIHVKLKTKSPSIHRDIQIPDIVLEKDK